MDTGNNTAGKTAPERYVSEKAFEELPDTFQKLAELLGEDQFELVAVNDEKDPQDQKAASESAFSEEMAEKPDDNIYRVDSYVKNGEIRLVYLMNDAVESFLVFGNARMTGVYKPDYEGEILADLSRQGREYILVVHQDDSVVTLFFETLSLEKHLYDYSRIGHFWVEGYEYLRQLEYRLAILRDKYDYIGGDSCNALEEKLSALVELTGGNYVVTGDYPGWKYRVHSPLREKMVKLYAEMYGNEPRVEAIHAGLECGLLGSKISDLDCVSMGPDMKDIHTTEETLSISSTKRVWEYLVKVLETKD